VSTPYVEHRSAANPTKKVRAATEVAALEYLLE
jgi:hypothetical protein